jgi:DNA-binding transcriptional ArsR family regulator
VIVKDGEILAESANKVAQTNDPTAHAEILAIRDAQRRLPCAMNAVTPRWMSIACGTSATVVSASRRSSRPTERAFCPCRFRYYLRMHAGNSEGRLPDDQAGLVVEVFRMLADATRVQVLWSLTHREMSVNELAEHVGKPAPSVSQHLAKLRMARLVRTRRDGTTIFYSLENDHVRQLVTDAVFNAEHAGPGVPRHHRAEGGLKAVNAPEIHQDSLRK